MMPHQTLQHKIDESAKIKDILMLLRHNYDLSNREIAAKCGVSEAFVSRALHGKTTSGRQFLAGLLLLKELTELKRSGVNQELSRELESMKQRIEQLQRQTSSRDEVSGGRRPPLQQGAAEEASSTPGGAVAIKAARVAVRAKEPRDPPLKK